jgi:hypothetical protein
MSIKLLRVLGRGRLVGRIGISGTAGVEHQNGDVGVSEQVAQLISIDRFCIILDRWVLEQQVTARPAFLAGQHQFAQLSQYCVRQAWLAQFGVSAVAVEVEYVVGLAMVLGCFQDAGQLLISWRAENVQLEAETAFFAKTSYDTAGN